MNQGGQVWAFLGGITTLFVLVIVLNNAKGVGQILTGLGNLYGTAANASHPAK